MLRKLLVLAVLATVAACSGSVTGPSAEAGTASMDGGAIATSGG